VTYSETPGTVGYYSVLRFVPVPTRDEAINIGLLLVGEGGTWAKFRWKVPRTRLGAAGFRENIDAIERWAETISNSYELDGEAGFSRPGRLDVNTLRTWASEFGGLLRLTAPRVAIDGDLEGLFVDLFRRYVGRSRREETAVALAEVARPVTGASEKREIVRALLQTMERWHAFDSRRVVRDQPFAGSTSSHVADVAIVNHTVTAVAQAIPFVHGSESEVIQTRALLVEAAVDLPEPVVKIGLHDDPPADRIEWLTSTQNLFLSVGGGLQLLPRRQFDQLGPRFEARFFPELGVEE
jgi:hypothetical protein